MSKASAIDAVVKRLTARHLAAPDPPSWPIAADRLEELGDEEGAVAAAGRPLPRPA